MEDMPQAAGVGGKSRADRQHDHHDDDRKPGDSQRVAPEADPGVAPEPGLLGYVPVDLLDDADRGGHQSESLTRGSMNTYKTSTMRLTTAIKTAKRIVVPRIIV